MFRLLVKNVLLLNFLLSIVLLLVFVLVVFLGSFPSLSVNRNVYDAYNHRIQKQFQAYFLNIERLVQNTISQEEFKKEANITLNEGNNYSITSGKFIAAPLKEIRFSLEKRESEKMFSVKDNLLVARVPYQNSFFSIQSVDFLFDFPPILREILMNFNSKFDVLITKTGNIYLKDKHLKIADSKIKDIDAFFSTRETKRGTFKLDYEDLTLKVADIKFLNNALFFIYREPLLYLPLASQIIILLLFLQSILLFVWVMKRERIKEEKTEEDFGEMPISHLLSKESPSGAPKKTSTLNNEILSLMEDIEKKASKSLPTSKERESQSMDTIRTLLKKHPTSAAFIEGWSQSSPSTRLLVLARRDEFFFFHKKVGVVGNQVESFQIPEKAPVVKTLEKGLVLSISGKEFEKSFIYQYLHEEDKKNLAAIFFVPILLGHKKNLKEILVLLV